MGKVSFKGIDEDHKVAERYSDGTGPVLRSDKSEIARVHFAAGDGAEQHHHPEEQIVFVEEGRIQVTLGEGDAAETYVVQPGQASFHPSNVAHRVEALEDSWVVSFKNVIDGSVYGETGRLA